MKISRWAALLVGSLCLLAWPAFGSDIPPVTPDELKMASESLAPGAPAILLYRQVDRDDSGNSAHENQFWRIKILKEEGRKYADVEIPFYKERGENIVNVHARTIRTDGSAVPFQGKPFDKYIAKAKGLKYMAKTFTLPDVQVGSVIEYSYTLDLPEHYVVDSRWILSDELFTKRARFSLKQYTSDYSRLGLRWSWHLLPAGAEPPKTGPDKIIRMEVNNVPAFQIEDYMPPENELKSRVDFTYTEDMQNDPKKFWQNRGKKLNGIVEGFVGKHKSMEEAVLQIVSASDPPEVKLQKIYARVQQIRNTSFEMEKTAQEQKRAKEKDNGSVEDVWKKGYGNGRELNWLFLALARAAGFEAYSVFLSDRRNYFFDPAMMDADKLDSDVVLVKVNGKDVFCDPGAAFTPFGLLEWPETWVPGLRLDKDGGTWISTAVPKSADSRVIHKADLTLFDTGDLEGKLTVIYTGLEAMRRRREERNDDEAERKKYLEDDTRSAIPAAGELELSNQPDWKSSDTPLVAEFKLKIPGWVSGAGRKAFLPVGLFSAGEKHVFEQEARVHAIYFQYPSQKEDDVNITLPPGWQASSVPSPKVDDAKAALYSLTVENNKQTIHLNRKMSLDLVILEQKYYRTLRNFFQLVRTGDDEQVVLQPGSATASN